MKITATLESLRKKSKEVTMDATEFCAEFKDFVKEHSCMSLTAPQVGKNLSIMAVKYRQPTRVYILVNPSIVKQGKKLVESKERTLDIKQPVMLTKQRPTWVVMQYQTPNLKHNKRRVFLGRRAAAALHAYEILNGTLR